MTTWRQEISDAMSEAGETFADIDSITLSDEELDCEFDSGYGGENGLPFTAWTKARVYFPVCYDGAEWVTSVARNPDGKPTEHVGGG